MLSLGPCEQNLTVIIGIYFDKIEIDPILKKKKSFINFILKLYKLKTHCLYLHVDITCSLLKGLSYNVNGAL